MRKMTIIAALGFLVSSVSFANAANIVETAQKAGTFNTLIAAAKAAGLAGTLAEGKNLTVFAPTDEAFAALPEGTVENLLKPENKDQLVCYSFLSRIAKRTYIKPIARSYHSRQKR